MAPRSTRPPTCGGLWPSLRSPPGLRPASAWTARELVVWGGQAGITYFADGAAYDPAVDRWRPLAPAPIEGRTGLGVWTGSELLVWGGGGGAPTGPSPTAPPTTRGPTAGGRWPPRHCSLGARSRRSGAGRRCSSGAVAPTTAWCSTATARPGTRSATRGVTCRRGTPGSRPPASGLDVPRAARVGRIFAPAKIESLADGARLHP